MKEKERVSKIIQNKENKRRLKVDSQVRQTELEKKLKEYIEERKKEMHVYRI